MIEILSNTWVVGIGGGILSGLVVTLISRLVLSRRENREYEQKVNSANRDVIYAIRPDISENAFPERAVVEALIRATATRYSVDSNDLFSPRQIADQLTAEIMDSSFISASKKREYCAGLEILTASAETTTPMDPRLSGVEMVRATQSDLGRYRERMVRMMSAMMGLVVALMSVLLVVFDSSALNSLGEREFPIPESVFLPLAAGMLAVVAAAAMSVVMREQRRLRERRREKAETEGHRSISIRHSEDLSEEDD